MVEAACLLLLLIAAFAFGYHTGRDYERGAADCRAMAKKLRGKT